MLGKCGWGKKVVGKFTKREREREGRGGGRGKIIWNEIYHA